MREILRLRTNFCKQNSLIQRLKNDNREVPQLGPKLRQRRPIINVAKYVLRARE
jgi:hypothetical protein